MKKQPKLVLSAFIYLKKQLRLWFDKDSSRSQRKKVLVYLDRNNLLWDL